MKVNANQFV